MCHTFLASVTLSDLFLACYFVLSPYFSWCSISHPLKNRNYFLSKIFSHIFLVEFLCECECQHYKYWLTDWLGESHKCRYTLWSMHRNHLISMHALILRAFKNNILWKRLQSIVLQQQWNKPLSVMWKSLVMTNTIVLSLHLQFLSALQSLIAAFKYLLRSLPYKRSVLC